MLPERKTNNVAKLDTHTGASNKTITSKVWLRHSDHRTILLRLKKRNKSFGDLDEYCRCLLEQDITSYRWGDCNFTHTKTEKSVLPDQPIRSIHLIRSFKTLFFKLFHSFSSNLHMLIMLLVIFVFIYYLMFQLEQYWLAARQGNDQSWTQSLFLSFSSDSNSISVAHWFHLLIGPIG